VSDTSLLCAVCGTQGSDYERCSACQGQPTLEKRFVLREIIGRGAAGTTYRADDISTDQIVALKEMPLGHPDPKRLEQLNREARVLRQLSHPQIPQYIAHFTSGVGKQTAFYIAQEFIDGPTLDEEQEQTRYSEADVLGILGEIFQILEYLHQLAPPVIHRDIKPKNLIRRKLDGKLVLIDFGSVRDIVVDPTVGGSTIAGTYGYMAPEQYRGVAVPQSDLYSAGILAVVLLSRRTPIELVGPNHGLLWRDAVTASEGLCTLIDLLLKESFDERIISAERASESIEDIRTGRSNQPSDSETIEVTLALPKEMNRALRKRIGARSKWVSIILSFLAGGIGAQHWYLGQFTKGVLSVIFAGTGIPFLLSIFWGLRHIQLTDREFDQRYNPILRELQETSADSIARQLTELHALTDKGVLSKAEFEREKQRLLGHDTPELARVIHQESMPTIGNVIGSCVNLVGSIGEEIATQLKDEIKKHNRKK
jgi:serine/threonine protein kinase